jgi:hypothetical protein
LPPQSTARLKAEAAKNKTILAMLARLALVYWRPDFNEGQLHQLYAIYLEDLRDLPLKAVEEACIAWRRNGANKFFPTPGELRSAILTPDQFHFSGRSTWAAALNRDAQAEMRALEAREAAREMIAEQRRLPGA